MSLGGRFLAFAAAILTAGALCAGGIVQTTAGPLEGSVTLGPKLSCGSKDVRWNDVIFATSDAPASMPSESGAVRWADGEIWAAQVQSLNAGKLALRLPSGTQSQVGTDELRSIDLVGGLAAPAAIAESTLYRRKSEPIPGKLMWMDATQLGLDSLLGVVTLPREGCTRYTLAGATSTPADSTKTDEVALVDGSVYRGRMQAGAAALELEHSSLGKLSFPYASVRYVIRGQAGAEFLADMSPRVQSESVIGLTAAPQTVSYLRPQTAALGAAAGLRSIRVEPKTLLTYRLASRGPWTLRMRLERAAASKGDVMVRLASGDRKLAEVELAAGAQAHDLSVGFDGQELSVDVGFGQRLGFPCAVVLRDPVLLRSAGGQTRSADTVP